MHKWYVVQVLSTHEKKVKKALEEHRDLKGMAISSRQFCCRPKMSRKSKKGSTSCRKKTMARIYPCQNESDR